MYGLTLCHFNGKCSWTTLKMGSKNVISITGMITLVEQTIWLGGCEEAKMSLKKINAY